MKISVTTRALIQLIAGLALLLGSLALGFGAAGTIVAFIAGAILTGIGLGAPEAPLAAMAALDRWVATGLALASIALMLAGEATAGTLLLAVAVGQLLLTTATRWSSRVPVTH